MWVGKSWRRWGCHLLMSERQPLSHHLYIIGRIMERWRGAGVALEIWGKGGFSVGSDYRHREPMRLVHHGVEGQHEAWDLLHPSPRGCTLKQASPEHVVHGLMALLVDSIPLKMVGRGQHPLDAQRAHQFPPDIPHKFVTTIKQKAARCAEVRYDMPKEGVTHRACCMIAREDKNGVPRIAINKHDEKLMSVIGGKRAHNVN